VDLARYLVAVLMLLSVPPAIGLWYLIHPFAGFWRRFGARGTYLILLVPVLLLCWATWLARHTLLAADLGTSPILLPVVFIAAVCGAGVARQRRRQLNQRTLMGTPELSASARGTLLTDGIYGKTRNPRYIEFLLFLLAYVAFANHVGTWLLWLASFPALHLVVLLEEKELRERFGAEYDDYCRRVPRYLPRRLADHAAHLR
jgi:protein-S-isoprenylcysteine O-methyltransferase Ste14